MKKEKFKREVLKKAKALIQNRIDDFAKQIALLEETKLVPDLEDVDIVYNSQNEANHEISNTLAQSMLEAERNLTRLELIEITEDFSQKVEPDAIVFTNHGNFFVAVHTENFEVDGKEIMGISTKSPIFLKMLDLDKGATFQLRDVDYTIENVF